MTLRLILTRHAKSAWGEPALGDHDRPLSDRGEHSALALGRWLAERGYEPGQALVSTATRTRETWEGIAKAFIAPPVPEFHRALYLSDPEAMLAYLHKAKAPVVMLIAHNPGIAFLAQALATKQPDDLRFGQYPSGATTVFDFPVDDWGGVTWASGTICDLAFPRDLI